MKFKIILTGVWQDSDGATGGAVEGAQTWSWTFCTTELWTVSNSFVCTVRLSGNLVTDTVMDIRWDRRTGVGVFSVSESSRVQFLLRLKVYNCMCVCVRTCLCSVKASISDSTHPTLPSPPHTRILNVSNFWNSRSLTQRQNRIYYIERTCFGRFF